MKKRVLSLFMALALCFSMLPTAALATENTTEPSTQLTETTSVPEEPEEPETPDQPEETKTPDQGEETKTPDQGEDAKTPDQPEEPPQDEEPPAAEEAAPVGAMLSAAATTGEEHTHYLCGGDTCNKVGHADEGTATTFQPWDGSNTNGAFYLTKDWTLTSTITVLTGSSLTLCLNGHSITLGSQAHNVNPGSYDVFLVQRRATFTLCDCKDKDKNGNYGTIGHYNPTENQGPGVNVEGTFNMYGGKIFQNQVKSYDGNPRGYGGGVLVSRTGTFNMFGGEITGNTAKSGGGVYVDGMFSMSGGTIYDNAGERGGGVYVTPNGMFNMSGSAAITGNTGSYGGVYVKGTFSMSGGTICGNTESSGGGVYVDYSGTFNMSGSAAITGNTVTGNGGGVYVRDIAKKMNVSGDVTITENKKADKTANNVYLPDGKTITIDESLSQNARIGVTTAKAPTSNGNILIATGATKELSHYTNIFTPDVQNQGCVIAKNGDNLSVHQHSWGYTESGATIIAKCSQCDASGGSVTIAAPAELTYSGEAKPATVTASSDWQGPAVNDISIDYSKMGTYGQQILENGALPTNAGEYTASITLGKATASVEYTIAKAALTVTPNSGQRKSYGTTPDPVLAYTSTGTVTGETAAFDGALSREAGEDVGTYNITKGSLALEDSDTFKAINYNLVLDTAVVTFEITKGIYGGSAPTKTVNILKNYAGVQTGTLTAADFFPANQLPDGAKITGVTPGSGTLMSTVDLTDGKFSYVSKDNLSDAADEAYTVTIATTNYTDITGALTFKLVDKTDVSAQITFPNGTLTYNGAGQKYEKATISTTAAGTPVWTYIYAPADATASLDSAGLPKTAGTYTVTAKYEDDANLGTKNAKLTISKATPTGAPTCTKITTSGKTLADAPLAIGTIAPAGGTLAWDMAATTVVAANTAYGWTYTPADTANYKALTGSLTPYAVSSGGGGGGGSSAATPSVSDKAAKELKNAKEGSTVAIDMKGETKLPASVTKEIAGKDVTVELDMGGGMVWSFNGLDVPKGGVSLNLGVKTGTKTIPAKVIHALTGETTTIQLQLNHNGPFGMSLKLSVDLGKKHDGLYANLYFYNPKSSALEFRSAGMISGGKASWAFDHASDYAIVIDKESHEPMTFTDVPDTAYYAEAVNWAVAKKITEGVGNKLFGSNDPCTRAQIVTFLWRAAGSPGPKTMSGFSDVPADSYYAKAVAWAVENGITGGTGDGKFSPDATCTRAQAVTFLYRASGAPAVSGNAAFSDVATNAYYEAAVKWAEKNGITGGIGGGLFGSDNNCTRAQIVTFLYRSYQSK